MDKWGKICISETENSVSSISTVKYVPQPLENKSHFVCNRLFVGGFPPGTTCKELSAVFNKYGKVIGCNVMSEDTTKNYGFVTFEDMATAESVLKLYSLTRPFSVRGHTLKVKRAVFRPKKVTQVEGSTYHGKHHVVRYYGSACSETTHYEIIREKFRGVSSTAFGLVYIPRTSTWIQSQVPHVQTTPPPPGQIVYASPGWVNIANPPTYESHGCSYVQNVPQGHYY